MKEEFRLGDRIRMIECKDPYSPIMPGEKGTIERIDDMGTLFPAWDSGRRLGVCLKEDTVERVPLEQEFRGFDSSNAMSCGDEETFSAHIERAYAAIGEMEMAALDSGGAWVVRRTHLDRGHGERPPEYAFVEPDMLQGLLQGADTKNGLDAGYLKAGKATSFAAIAYGQGYSSPAGEGVVTEAFECKLLSSKAAADYRERIDAGWSDQGDGPMRMFFSPPDQQSLAQPIAECKKIFAQHERPRDMER